MTGSVPRPLRSPGLASAILMLALGLSTPEARAQTFEVGLQAGLERSDFDLDTDERRSGFTGAVTLAYWPEPFLGLRIEPGFVSRGASGLGGVGHDDELALDYVSLPLVAVIRPETGRVRPLLSVGLGVAFEVDCSESTDTGRVSCEDADVQTESPDVGVAAGLGVRVDVGRGALTLEGRIWRGLADVDGGTPEIENRSRSLVLGYVLTL